jgi:dephospho-CoA kinase
VKRRRRGRGDDRAYIVGVTGGAASGKTTFVELLAAGGPSRVIDADRLGHAILRRVEVARALAREFGDDVLDAQGAVRRPVLGPRAFATPESLSRLNAIVHPPLLAELDLVLAAHGRTPFAGLVILDAALLVEWDAGDRCDEVVAVLAKPATQVARLMRDRGHSEDEANAIVQRQLPGEVRAAYADIVIENDGTLQEFIAVARAAAGAIRARAAAALGSREGIPNAGQEETWTG